MTTIERQFLASAFEVEEQLRRGTSVDHLVSCLSWRTIGVMCGLSGEQTDELIGQLAAADQISIVDRAKRLMILSAGRYVGRDELETKKRRFRTRMTLIIVPLVIIVYWFIRSL